MGKRGSAEGVNLKIRESFKIPYLKRFRILGKSVSKQAVFHRIKKVPHRSQVQIAHRQQTYVLSLCFLKLDSVSLFSASLPVLEKAKFVILFPLTNLKKFREKILRKIALFITYMLQETCQFANRFQVSGVRFQVLGVRCQMLGYQRLSTV